LHACNWVWSTITAAFSSPFLSSLVCSFPLPSPFFFLPESRPAPFAPVLLPFSFLYHLVSQDSHARHLFPGPSRHGIPLAFLTVFDSLSPGRSFHPIRFFAQFFTKFSEDRCAWREAPPPNPPKFGTHTPPPPVSFCNTSWFPFFLQSCRLSKLFEPPVDNPPFRPLLPPRCFCRFFYSFLELRRVYCLRSGRWESSLFSYLFFHPPHKDARIAPFVSTQTSVEFFLKPPGSAVPMSHPH